MTRYKKSFMDMYAFVLLIAIVVILVCPATSNAASYTNWSSWSEQKPSEVAGRQIESRTVVRSYNLFAYFTQESQYPYYRNIRDYSINGNYSAYGVRSSYGEFYHTGVAPASYIDEAYRYLNGSYISNGGKSAYHRGNGTAYLLKNEYGDTDLGPWFIASENKVIEYQYRDQIIYYTVSFDPNGGSSSPSKISSSAVGTVFAIMLPTSKPVRNEYDFVGWATSRTATSAQYQPGDTYIGNNDVTFFAVWKKVESTNPKSGQNTGNSTASGASNSSDTSGSVATGTVFVTPNTETSGSSGSGVNSVGNNGDQSQRTIVCDSSQKANVNRGETVRIIVHFNGNVTWKSSNPKIATVSKDGFVRCKKKGRVVITAKCGKKCIRCTLVVVLPSLNISSTKISLTVGANQKIKATIKGCSKKVVWSSSNPDVARVSAKGVITAVCPGKAVVSACGNGITRKCVVIVEQKKKAKTKSTSNKTSSSETRKAKLAYKKLLSKRKVMLSPKGTPVTEMAFYERRYNGTGSSKLEFSLLYLDNDNVPELFVRDKTFMNALFAYKNNAVVRVWQTGSHFSSAVSLKGYYKHTGIFKGNSSLEGYIFTTFYDSYDGNQVHGLIYHEYSTDMPATYNCYESDGNYHKISKNEFNNLVSQYVGGRKMTNLKWIKNTDANRKRYLK